MLRRVMALCSIVLLSGGGALLAEQGWLAAKARVAAILIDAAFAAHLDDGGVHRPWSWADTHPIARLEVPRLAVRRTVLSGASGSSLAFGPGHVDGSAPPNQDGNCVLAGHRDSWFRFLDDLKVGDRLSLRTRAGERPYEVTAVLVTSTWDPEVLATTRERRLTLVTCYPFGGLGPSDRRYVVICKGAREREASGPEAQRGLRRVNFNPDHVESIAAIL